MNKKLLLCASLVCALPTGLQSSFWQEFKLAYATGFTGITYPFRLLWNRLIWRQRAPSIVKPHEPVVLSDGYRTVRIEGIQTLRQTVADCSARAAVNASLMYTVLSYGLNPAKTKTLITQTLIDKSLNAVKRAVSNKVEIDDQSEEGVWYDEYQMGTALKAANSWKMGKYAGPNDEKGIAFYDWERKQFRLRNVDGDLIKSQGAAIRALKQPGIHQIIICDNAHSRALVIHRAPDATTYYYADSFGASTPWTLPVFRTILSTLEEDNPYIVEQFNRLR